MKNILKNQQLIVEKNFINNAWIDADSKETLLVTNPFNQEVLGSIPFCSEVETLRAVEAAQYAQTAWKSRTSLERANYLHVWANLIEANLEDLSILMTLEHGKPLVESSAEIIWLKKQIFPQAF